MLIMRVLGETVAGEANARRLVTSIDRVGGSVDAWARRWRMERVRAVGAAGNRCIEWLMFVVFCCVAGASD